MFSLHLAIHRWDSLALKSLDSKQPNLQLKTTQISSSLRMSQHRMVSCKTKFNKLTELQRRNHMAARWMMRQVSSLSLSWPSKLRIENRRMQMAMMNYIKECKTQTRRRRQIKMRRMRKTYLTLVRPRWSSSSKEHARSSSSSTMSTMDQVILTTSMLTRASHCLSRCASSSWRTWWRGQLLAMAQQRISQATWRWLSPCREAVLQTARFSNSPVWWAILRSWRVQTPSKLSVERN